MAIACDLDCNKELNVIFKGTTPTFNFNACLDTSLVDIENTHIVFTSGRAVVDKSGDDIIIGEGVMSCSLTQEETVQKVFIYTLTKNMMEVNTTQSHMREI